MAVVARNHGLDSLRGIAAMWVVMLHAAIPYSVAPLCTANWAVVETVRSALVDALQWWIEAFIMPLFFLMAGFFSLGLLKIHGARRFLSHRTRRVFWPLVAAALIVLPLTLWIWLLGWASEGRYVPEAKGVLGLPDQVERDLFGLAHLWFLEYLFIYCVGLAAMSKGISLISELGAIRQLRAAGAKRRLKWLLASPVSILLGALPCTVILTWDPRIVTGVYQIWLPALTKLAYYAIYFFAGALWHKYRASLADLGRRYAWLLAASVVFFAPSLMLIRQHKLVELQGIMRLAMGGAIVLFAWCTSLGLIGLFLHRAAQKKLLLSYLGEASYWVYLTHFPVVGLAQVSLYGTALPIELKFAITLLAAMAVTLLSYQAAVRYTAIGEFLNGHRHGRPGRSAGANVLARTAKPDVSTQPLRRAA
jgi:peptidoglycan/LPS O-acetylase OafA/YrhL